MTPVMLRWTIREISLDGSFGHMYIHGRYHTGLKLILMVASQYFVYSTQVNPFLVTRKHHHRSNFQGQDILIRPMQTRVHSFSFEHRNHAVTVYLNPVVMGNVHCTSTAVQCVRRCGLLRQLPVCY